MIGEIKKNEEVLEEVSKNLPVVYTLYNEVDTEIELEDGTKMNGKAKQLIGDFTMERLKNDLFFTIEQLSQIDKQKEYLLGVQSDIQSKIDIINNIINN